MVIIPFLLNMDTYTVKVFVAEVPEKFSDFNQGNFVELQTASFETLHEAETFYLSLYKGVYINQVITEYFMN